MLNLKQIVFHEKNFELNFVHILIHLTVLGTDLSAFPGSAGNGVAIAEAVNGAVTGSLQSESNVVGSLPASSYRDFFITTRTNDDGTYDVGVGNWDDTNDFITLDTGSSLIDVFLIKFIGMGDFKVCGECNICRDTVCEYKTCI